MHVFKCRVGAAPARALTLRSFSSVRTEKRISLMTSVFRLSVWRRARLSQGPVQSCVTSYEMAARRNVRRGGLRACLRLLSFSLSRCM